MNDAPSQSQDKFIVRLPDGMRERLKAVADANRRSMNQEIVAALADHIDTEEYHIGWSIRMDEMVAEGPPVEHEFDVGDLPVSLTRGDVEAIVQQVVAETLRALGLVPHQ